MPDRAEDVMNAHDRLVAAIGGYANLDTDPRVDLPLDEQVKRLMEWACSQRPADFRRSVPVDATDHDVLITSAIPKLVKEIVRLRAALAEKWEDVDV